MVTVLVIFETKVDTHKIDPLRSKVISGIGLKRRLNLDGVYPLKTDSSTDNSSNDTDTHSISHLQPNFSGRIKIRKAPSLGKIHLFAVSHYKLPSLGDQSWDLKLLNIYNCQIPSLSCSDMKKYQIKIYIYIYI